MSDTPRFRRLVEHLHGGGPRLVGEYLSQLLKSCPTAPVCDLLEEYRQIDIDQLRQFGADKWAPVVMLVPDSILSGRATHAAILRRSLQPVDGGDAA
jgi:hypothetical protein